MTTSSTSNILQQAFILATGTAASDSMLAQFEALVQQDGGGYGLVAQQVEAYMAGLEASQGTVATVKALALNGLGIVLSDSEAASIKASLAAQGINTWAKIFEFCINLQSSTGLVLDNRADAAQAFDAALASAGKASLFAGATVQAAVKEMLQDIGSSDASLQIGIAGLDAIANNLSASGLQGAGVDGAVSGATVFVDVIRNGAHDSTEFSTTTDAAGHYVIPSGTAAGVVILTGGAGAIDLMTGETFRGTLTGLPGSTVVNPLTTMIEALVDGGIAGTVSLATAALQQALGLPAGINLLSYDPIAVLASSTATAAEKAVALAVETKSAEIANVLTELTAVIDAAKHDGSSAAATVAAALASAIWTSAAANGGTGTIDLTDVGTLTQIVQAAGTAAGSATVTAHALQIAEVIAGVNDAADGSTTIFQLAQVEIVAQGAAVDALAAGGTSGSFDLAVLGFTGTNLTNLIHAAVPGFLAPGVPVPPDAAAPPPPAPPPSKPPFDVNIQNGIVTFIGTATGDITLSWAGTPGASAATFYRGGFTSLKNPAFPSPATTISPGSGDKVVASAAQVLGVSFGGAGVLALTDTTLAAATVNTIDGAVACSLDLSALGTLTGAAADVLTVYASGGITGLGNEAVTLSDTTLAASSLNSVDVATTGAVDASSVTTLTGTAAAVAAAYASAGITGLGDEAVTLSDTTLAAATLDTIDAATSGAIDASAATTLTGTAANVAAAYASAGITGLGDEAVTLSDTTLAAATLDTIDAATTGAVDASAATTLTGTAADVAAAYASAGITGLGNEAVTLSDTTLDVVTLNTVDTATSGLVDASAATTLTGTAADVATSYASAGITGLGDEAVTLSDTTLGAIALNGIDSDTTGIVDASSVTTLTGAATDVAASYASAGISGLGDEAVTLSDTTLAAATLDTIDAATSGAVDASAATTLTGTAADVATAYASVGITGLGDEAVTLSDTTLAAATLDTIDAATSGAVDASAATTLTGTAADVAAAYASAGITGLGDEAVTLSDTTLAADVLNTIDAATTGAIDASAATTLTGTAADVAAAYASAGITGLGDEAVTLSDTTLAADVLNTIDAATTGLVDASATTTLTGTAAQVTTAYASAGITGLGDEAVTLSDTTLGAIALNAIDSDTTGIVDASSITTLTGAASDVAASYASAGISGLGDEAVTLSDTSLAAATLDTIDAATSGAVAASAAATLTGTAADVATAYASGGITGLGDEAVTLSDTTLAAATLNTIDAATTGVVDAGAATTLTGTAADVAASYAANTAGTITGLGDEAVTLSDTTLAAGVLNTIDAATTGLVDASSVTTLTGNAGALNTAYASPGITGLGDEAVTLTNTTVSAAALNNLDAATTGLVDAGTVTTLTGSEGAVAAAYASPGITGLGDEAVTLTNTTLTAATLNTIDAATTGLVDAGAATALNGTAAQVAAAYASPGITGLGDETVTLSDNSLAAATLLVIDAATTGVVDASAANALTGTAADATAAYAANTAGTVSGLGDENVVLSDTTLGAATLNALDTLTTGIVKAGSVTTLTGAAADVAASYAANTAGTVNGLGNEAVTLSDTTLAASVLNGIDAATSGTVDAGTVTTLTGLAADVAASYASGGISGLGDEAVTLSDTTLAAGVLNTIDAATSGLVDAGTVTTLTGSANGIANAYASAGIVGLGDEAVTLNDTTLAAGKLDTIDAATTGLVDAGAATTLTGTAFAVSAAYASAGITGLGNEAVTLSNTTLAAATLNTIDLATTGVVDAGAATTLTGLAADVLASYAANTATTISGLGDEAVTLSDTTLAATDLNAVDLATSGVVDASSVAKLTGAAVDITAAYAANTAGTISGLGDEIVQLTDTALGALALNAIDAATSGLVKAGSITTLTGAAVDVLASYAAKTAGTISLLGNEAVTLSDTSLAAAALDAINAATSGVVDASAATTLTGLAADVASAYAANAGGAISGLGGEAVTLSDTTLDAATLNTIDTRTSGVVDASAASTLAGLAVDVVSAYAAFGAGSISGLGDEAVTLSDATLAAGKLNTIDGATTGVVDASAATTLTGTAAAVNAAYAANTAGTVSGLGDEAVTLSNTSVSAAALSSVDAATSGLVDASAAATLTGGATALAAVYASGGIIGLGNEAVTLNDTTLAATDLNVVDADTTGVVDASTVTKLTGAAVDVAASYAANTATTIFGLGDEIVQLTDTTLGAASLLALDTATTGIVKANTVVTLSGNFADLTAVKAAVVGGTISVSGSINVAMSDTAANLTGQTYAASSGSSDSLAVGVAGAATNLSALTGFESITLAGSTDTTLDAVTIANGAGTSITATGAVGVKLGNGGQIFSGSAGADIITGGSGNDDITGGNGADTIKAAGGQDTIHLADSDNAVDVVILNSALNANADTILGFVSGQDVIQFARAALGLNTADYTAGAVTAITAAGAAALGAGAWNNHVVIDTSANIATLVIGAGSATGAVLAVASDTGQIYFDADGNFSAGAVLIGTAVNVAVGGDLLIV
jgi:hypothetical protein